MGVFRDLKLFLGFIAVIAMIVIGASIYFTLTTPAGQTGLAGIGLAIAQTISAPFIAAGNGIASIFKYYLNPANWHLVIDPQLQAIYGALIKHGFVGGPASIGY